MVESQVIYMNHAERETASTASARPLPRYREVKQRLAELLREGKWRHGQAIPSEPLLAQRFGVSIGTLRKAVDELVAENILEREQGRGTFVRSHTRDYMLNVFFQLVDAEGRKELPQIELLSFARWRADAGTAERQIGRASCRERVL